MQPCPCIVCAADAIGEKEELKTRIVCRACGPYTITEHGLSEWQGLTPERQDQARSALAKIAKKYAKSGTLIGRRDVRIAAGFRVGK
jgi:hypothetical protein